MVANSETKELDIKELDITEIEADEYRLRITEPNADEDRALEQSIASLGLLHPLVVSKRGGRYHLISGHRRLAALLRQGVKQASARIIDDADEKHAMAIAVSENLVRRDLNPIDKALGLQRLKELGMSQKDIAMLIGRKEPEISNLLSLFKLEPEVIEEIKKGNLQYPHAKALLTLRGQRDLQLQALNTILEKKLSVRATEQLIRDLCGRQQPIEALKLPQNVRVERKAHSTQLVFTFEGLAELQSQIEQFLRQNAEVITPFGDPPSSDNTLG
jgi:ParB family chromosome partitioning protein